MLEKEKKVDESYLWDWSFKIKSLNVVQEHISISVLCVHQEHRKENIFNKGT